MKVLQINSICGSGSTGRIVEQLSMKVNQEGDLGIVAYGRNSYIGPVQTIKIGNKVDQYVHAGLSRIFDKQGLYSKFSTLSLIKKIKEINPDVIHLHNLHGYYLHYPTLFAYLAIYPGKIVWTLHDCWAITGHCTHFDYVQCNKWKSQCSQCPQKREYPKSVLMDSSEDNYKLKKRVFQSIPSDKLVIVCPSNWLANLVKESFLNKFEIVVIHNGVDTSKFHPIKSNFKERYKITDKKVILGVSDGWTEKKGYDTFIGLANELKDTEYQIVLVGVSEGQKQELSKKGIIGIERTQDIEELVGIYSGSDIFLNPTLEDTFPTVNLEAQACGLPVITNDVCGCKETIINGIARCTTSIDKLKTLIIEDNGLKYEKMDRFNQNKFLSEYMNLYRFWGDYERIES